MSQGPKKRSINSFICILIHEASNLQIVAFTTKYGLFNYNIAICNSNYRSAKSKVVYSRNFEICNIQGIYHPYLKYIIFPYSEIRFMYE